MQCLHNNALVTGLLIADTTECETKKCGHWQIMAMKHPRITILAGEAKEIESSLLQRMKGIEGLNRPIREETDIAGRLSDKRGGRRQIRGRQDS